MAETIPNHLNRATLCNFGAEHTHHQGQVCQVNLGWEIGFRLQLLHRQTNQAYNEKGPIQKEKLVKLL